MKYIKLFFIILSFLFSFNSFSQHIKVQTGTLEYKSGDKIQGKIAILCPRGARSPTKVTVKRKGEKKLKVALSEISKICFKHKENADTFVVISNRDQFLFHEDYQEDLVRVVISGKYELYHYTKYCSESSMSPGTSEQFLSYLLRFNQR